MWTTLALAGLAAISAAAPTANTLTDFLLVTTSSCESSANSASLPDVNATSLFDPAQQTDFYLRLIGPGYGSLPRFNLTQGTLHTDAENELAGFEVEQYNSTTVVPTEQLILDPAPQADGNLGLESGFLLAVNGDVDGWTVCQGTLGESVIYWKGNSTTCVKRYIQAVKDAPY